MEINSSFKLHTVLRSVEKSYATLLYFIRYTNHPFIQASMLYILPLDSCLVVIWFQINSWGFTVPIYK